MHVIKYLHMPNLVPAPGPYAGFVKGGSTLASLVTGRSRESTVYTMKTFSANAHNIAD